MEISRSNRFKKEYKKAKTQHDDLYGLLNPVVMKLIRGKQLAPKYRDHSLQGKYVGCRDCHLKPDLILIYRITEDELYLYRLGSHSELF